MPFALPFLAAGGAASSGGLFASLGGASGVGSILSGIGSIGGLFGKKSKGPSLQDQLDTQTMSYRTQIRDIMNASKEHGIHPLALLGSPTTGGSANVISSAPESNKFQDFAMAGSELARSISAGQSNMEKLQERLLIAQIQGQEIDNVSRASMVARVNQPGNPPGMPETVRTVPKEVIAGKYGMEDGTRQAGQYFNFLGTNIPTLSSDMVQSGLDEGPINWANQIFNVAPRMLYTIAAKSGQQTGRYLRQQYDSYKQRR